MVKKKRIRKKSVFIALEGKREYIFFCFLKELFNSENINITEHKDYGGTSNAILDRAMKSPHKYTYAWFDEDDKLDKEHRKELEKRWNVKIPFDKPDYDLQKLNKKCLNPIVIVSTPLSIEGIIIRLFNKNIPNLRKPIRDKNNFELNKKMMKNSINGIFGNSTDIDYYRQNLTKEYLIDKSKEIEELKLLLSIFDIK